MTERFDVKKLDRVVREARAFTTPPSFQAAALLLRWLNDSAVVCAIEIAGRVAIDQRINPADRATTERWLSEQREF
jgi:hypothetical protein